MIIQNLAGRTILLDASLQAIQNGVTNKMEIEAGKIDVALETYFGLMRLEGNCNYE